MADQKLTQLTEMTTPSDDDLMYMVDNPGGTPASRKITWANIKANIPSGGGAVDSVFGRTGVVIAVAGDYVSSFIEDDSVFNPGGALSDSIDALALAISLKQDYSATLASIAPLGSAADRYLYTTGVNSWAEGEITAFIRTLLNDSDASTARATLELGSLASVNGGFTGGGTLATGGFTLTVPATGTAALLATTNTFTAAQMIQITDAATATSAIGLTLEHQSSGTPTTSFGTSIKFLLESSTTVGQDAALIDGRWQTATHATRLGVLELSAYYITTKTSLQIFASTSDSYARLAWGSNPDISVYRSSSDIVLSAFAAVTTKTWNGSGYVNAFQVDGSVVAGNTRMLIYDVDNATVERVTVGIADSGGAGYKVLRIPN